MLFIISAAVLWIASLAAVGFAQIEQHVIRVAALLAIATSITALIAVVTRARRGQYQRRFGWLLLLFIADTAVALAPSAYAKPWYAQGRFTNVPHWIPTAGGIAERTKAALKIYGVELVPHLLVQALGLALSSRPQSLPP